MGKIKIEDKLAPVITCPAPVTVSCWDSRTFLDPVVTDNCTRTPCTASRPITLTLLSDVTTELECSNDNRAVRRIRYQAKDASNNLSTVCERVIYYSKITLTDVKFPKNYDGTPKTDLTYSVMVAGHGTHIRQLQQYHSLQQTGIKYY
ncbi:MAG: hypothetical protein IPP49_13000 [Saprospiraceae bacterium]|nr:hypothetical protein [Saprospiraceae bacterium]